MADSQHQTLFLRSATGEGLGHVYYSHMAGGWVAQKFAKPKRDGSYPEKSPPTLGPFRTRGKAKQALEKAVGVGGGTA